MLMKRETRPLSPLQTSPSTPHEQLRYNRPTHMRPRYPGYKNPRPLMTPWLVDAVTGLISNRAFSYIGVSSDGLCLMMCGEERDWPHRGPEESLHILRQLSDIAKHLEAEGMDGATVILDIDLAGQVIVLSRSDPQAKQRVRRLTDDELTTLRAPLGSPSRPGSVLPSSAMPIDGREP